MSTAPIATCLTELGSADLARVTEHDYDGLRSVAKRTCAQLHDADVLRLPSDAADDLAQDAVLALAYSLRAAQQWTPWGADGDLVLAWSCERPGAESLLITRQTLHAWAVWQALLSSQPCPTAADEPDLEFLADLDRFDIGQLAAA